MLPINAFIKLLQIFTWVKKIYFLLKKLSVYLLLDI